MIVKDLSGLEIEKGEIVLRVQNSDTGHYLDPLALILFDEPLKEGAEFRALLYAFVKPADGWVLWESPKYALPKDFTLHWSSGGGGNIPITAERFYVGKEDVLFGIRGLGKDYHGYSVLLEELLIPRNKQKA